MKLRYLIMERFKRFKEPKKIEFSDGINIIFGPNESGKSTTLLALEIALFESVLLTKYKPEELISWGTDKGWLIELCGEEVEGQFKVFRDLSNKKEYIELNDGKKYTNKDKIQEMIGEILTFTDKAILSSTMLIRQGEMITLEEGSLSNRLKALISGTYENIEEIIERARRLSISEDKNLAGPKYIIKETNNELERLKEKFNLLESKSKGVMENRTKLQNDKNRYKEVTEELSIKKDLLEKNLLLIQKQKEKDDIEKRWKQFREYQGKKELKKARITKLSEYPPIIQYDYETLKYTKAQLSIVPIGGDKGMKILGYVLSGIGIITMAFGVVRGLITGFKSLEIITSILGAILLTGGIVLSFVKGKTIKTDKIKSDMNNILLKYNTDDIDDFIRKFDEKSEIEKNISDLELVLSTIRGGLSEDDYENSMSSLDIKYSALEKEINELKIYEKEPEGIIALEKEVTKLEEEERNLDSEIKGIDHYLRENDFNPDELTSTTEQIDEKKLLVRDNEYRAMVYEEVYNILSEANIEVSKEIVPKIEEEMNKYIKMITINRYQKVKLNEEDLSISTYIKEVNGYSDVSNLSFATIEQFYLVARIAIGDHLTGDKKLPLLLDDPFVHYDDMRFNKTMDIIKEMSRERQVIIFTCHDRYNKWADKITELQ